MADGSRSIRATTSTGSGDVVIGRGRDAADVAMVTSFGQIEMVGMTVRAESALGTSWTDRSHGLDVTDSA